jgi:hypothetical protein
MENLAAILKHKEKNYSLKDLTDTTKLTPLELKIINARTKGYSFCQLDENNKKLAVDQIMLRVAAICGCPLPNTEFFAKFIAEEITIFILDFGYQEFTLEEILSAFRFNATGGLKYATGVEIDQVYFTGSCVNVDYIAKVLSNYLIIRKILDRKLQNKIDGYEL